MSQADVLVMGVPSHGFRAALEEVAAYLRPWVPVVSLTKGLELGTRLRMSEVITEVVPGHPVGVLTGPNLAKEILAGHAAASVMAMDDHNVACALQRLFATDALPRVHERGRRRLRARRGAEERRSPSRPGMADGLGAGDNTRATVITRGLNELTHLGLAMGGEQLTFAGLAGMGDLLATCISPQSRNRHVGEQLGKGKTIDEVIADMNMVAEGVKTSKVVMEMADEHGVDMPIASRGEGGVPRRRHRDRGLPGPAAPPDGSRDPRRHRHRVSRSPDGVSWSDADRHARGTARRCASDPPG